MTPDGRHMHDQATGSSRQARQVRTSNMSKQCDIVERTVNAALADIEKYAPQEFQKLQTDPAKKLALIQAAREAAEEEVKLAEEFHTLPPENVAERLSKHLPQNRVELIKTGLEVPTYHLDISKKADGHHWADITRDGKVFMQSQVLESSAAIGKSTYIQMASIVIEGVHATRPPSCWHQGSCQ